MAEACLAYGSMAANCTAEASAPQRSALFINDDACGDWLIPIGKNGFGFQVSNAATAICFIAAGAPLVFRATSPIARAYGFMMCGVGIGSFSFHATGSLSGFLIDIVPMAVTAALMLFKAIHALQADAGMIGPQAESTRWFISMAASFFAVYTPWVMLQMGASHFTVWGMWALLFGSMGAIFGVISIIVFVNEGAFNGSRATNLGVAIACVLLGLGCTIHSFLPGLCEGWRTVFPLHALWHLFSSVTANRCGHILDELTQLVEGVESDFLVGERKLGSKRESLLVRLMKRDILPSQFSM